MDYDWGIDDVEAKNAAARGLVLRERITEPSNFRAVSHLNGVADTPELRAAYNEALPRVTEFWTRLGSDERLYAKYKAMDPKRLNPEQARALQLALKNFVLSGAELQGQSKARFAQIQERLAALSQQFSEHVLDATDQWGLLVQAQELDGVPQEVLLATAQAAQARCHGRGRINVDPSGVSIADLENQALFQHQGAVAGKGFVTGAMGLAHFGTPAGGVGGVHASTSFRAASRAAISSSEATSVTAMTRPLSSAASPG